MSSYKKHSLRFAMFPKRNFCESRCIFSQTLFVKTTRITTTPNFKNSTEIKQSSYQNSKFSSIETRNLRGPEVFFNTCFDKNNLKTLIAWFLEQYGQKRTVDLVETLKEVGFHQATLAGISLGVDDLQIPPQKTTLLSQASIKMETVTTAIQTGNLTSVEKSQRLIDTWNQTSETLRQTAVQNFRTTNPVNPVYMMAFSGARGNISQVRQLVAMRGLMADPQGAILEFPIQSNFREGLTVTEYLLSCYGARKGLVDTALRTATSGYLTRRLVDAVQHVVVHVTDCETEKAILLKNKNLEQRLIGRVLFEDIRLNQSTVISKNTLISHRLAKQIALKYKEILVRSPLTCKTEKSVCQLCYGIDLAQGKLVSIGEAVGIIAAQSIGEPGTQLTMRTFHTGGVGVFSDQALKSFTAPFEGKIHFFESLSGLFVRTPHGNIVYLLKHNSNEKTTPLLRLIPVSQSSPIYEISHSEVPSGSLLWVKQGEVVKSGQLLIQASRLQTATQEMPESSHPVSSPISGEVFFQSMAIRIIEEEKRALQKSKKKKQQKNLSTIVNQKEMSPTFPTLVELGNFWVFSSFIQKEFGFSRSFFMKGDLLSLDTPVNQYNLYLPYQGELKKFKISTVLSSTRLGFLFSKIVYSNLVYFLCQERKNQNLISYTANSKQILLTWYPFLKKFSFHSLGYFYFFPAENQTSHLKTYDLSELESQRLRYIWAPYKVLKLKKSQFFQFQKTKNFVFRSSITTLISGANTLSEKGLFQFKKEIDINKLKKTRFQKKFLKNSLKKEKIYVVGNFFLKTALKKAQDLIFEDSPFQLIQKNSLWFYVPDRFFVNNFGSQNTKVILEFGKNFEKIKFQHCSVFTNSIKTENLFLFQSKKNARHLFSFYNIDEILNIKKEFLINKSVTLSGIRGNTHNTTFTGSRKNFNSFCFYKKEANKELSNLKYSLKRRKHFSNLISFQKTSDQILPDRKFFKENWYLNTKISSQTSIKSPLFTKQNKTIFKVKEKPESTFKHLIVSHSGWFSMTQIFKMQLLIQSLKNNKKIEQFHYKKVLNLQHQQEMRLPGFQLLFYQHFRLNNSSQFHFQTFRNGSTLPNNNITSAFLKSKKLGEFRGFQKKQKETFLNIVRKQDLITLKLPQEKYSNVMKIGSKVRWGQEILSGFAAPMSGQILNWSKTTLTLRSGIPLLASVRGLIHISHNDFIEKGDLLITLRSRRLQTEDIVQGIPKIEQLFEARETQGGEILQNNMHNLLNTFFLRARQVKPIQEAVELSLTYIQKYLVDNILSAYSTQGVHIAEKHVEVVVRQMTARVRITQGGDSGLLPGEFIQIRLIENVNDKLSKLGRRPAQYEPVILGITKSVLQSESFLLAASFQQVSKVLVRSALSRKTDFLRGLHENVLVGQAIPAGTGMIELNLSFEKDSHEK